MAFCFFFSSSVVLPAMALMGCGEVVENNNRERELLRSTPAFAT